jgi:hypothetical protein
VTPRALADEGEPAEEVLLVAGEFADAVVQDLAGVLEPRVDLRRADAAAVAGEGLTLARAADGGVVAADFGVVAVLGGVEQLVDNAAR